MDAISLLREDHERVLAVLAELEAQPERRGAVVPADLVTRHRMVTELIMVESAHEAVEEQFFWPAVRTALPDGDQLAEAAIEQETAAKQVLAKLERLGPTEPEFETLLSQVIADGREHIRYEQDEVWPRLEQAMDTAALVSLGEKMAKAKKLAPTRPHPHTPPNPTVLRTAGVAAAVTDKLRDAASGRGKD